MVLSLSTGPEEETKAQEGLDELEALLRTLGIEIFGRFLQKKAQPNARTLFGRGKIEEVKALAEEKCASMIVSDHPLSPPQVRNLEEYWERPVFDRTGVILAIFSRHARSPQSKTQVEIARLEYLLPRLTGAWTHFQRQSGGGVVRGMGETQIEIDRRRARERLSRLGHKLEQYAKEAEVRRKARQKELKVALVGYTNSGKTTLMTRLTQSQTEGKDELFATLDTQIKTIDPRTRPKILLSDTVGFIRNLPHSLVASFRSTLSEVLEADLILEVIDASHPLFREHRQTTEEVLKEIGAHELPRLLVYNKADMLDPQLIKILRSGKEQGIVISAHDQTQILELREKIYEFFKQGWEEWDLFVAHEDLKIQRLIHNRCLILAADFSDHRWVHFRVQGASHLKAQLAAYMTQIEEIKDEPDTTEY